MSQPRFIVAEVTKTWWQGQHNSEDKTLLSQRFEKVINVNLERGYALNTWKLSQVFLKEKEELTETIIAIFEKL